MNLRGEARIAASGQECPRFGHVSLGCVAAATHVMLTSHRNGLTRSELFDASPQLTCLHRTAEGRKLPFTAEDRKPAFTAVRSMSESLPPERS